MDITNMSPDELKTYIQQLETAATQREKEISDLTAERDSYKDENDRMKTENTKLTTDLSDAKKLNFTLARSVGGHSKKSAENMIYDMFFNKK